MTSDEEIQQELEELEAELDEEHPIDCTCIFCIPGA
jgi:hypothetical protein